MSNSFLSRRRFTQGLAAAGGMALLGMRGSAADFSLRQFHNQPADTPLHRRLVAMWAAVKAETHGRVDVQTFADNNQLAGGDPQALKMLISGDLDFFTLNGGLIGTVVPAINVQGIPFAFRTEEQAYAAMDGDLGDNLHEEMKAKGIYAVPKAAFENGFRQISCSVRPIRIASDLEGIKMRSPDSPIYIECWQALGATPVAVNFNKLYDALKDHTADAQDNPLNVVDSLKLYEVQKYISMTSHMWSGFNLIANLKTWESIPGDLRAVIERNAAKYTRLQRKDTDRLNHSLQGSLEQRGMLFNSVDPASFRARLGGYYARWQKEIGAKTWSLLEQHVGKLGA